MTITEPFVGTLIRAGWEETQALGEDRAFVVRIRLDGPVSWPMQAVWQAWPVTVSRAEASSPTLDGVIKERGEDGRRPDGHGLSLRTLHAANIARQAEWCPDQVPDLSFRGNELAGEVGEACNVVKKLERERHGWRGSRATLDDLAQELADVVICASLCAVTAGIDLDAAVVAKFNATSRKQGLSTLLPEAPASTVQPPLVSGERGRGDRGVGAGSEGADARDDRCISARQEYGHP